MLKIELIKFEAQDVITASVAGSVTGPVAEVQQRTCYCDNGCGYQAAGNGMGQLKHSPHEPCTKCKFNLYQFK